MLNWPHKGRPDITLRFVRSTLLWFVCPMLLIIALFYGDPEYQKRVYQCTAASLAASTIIAILIARDQKSIAHYQLAMAIFKEHHMGHFDNLPDLKDHARRIAVSLYCNVIDHSGKYGSAEKKIAAEKEFETFWEFMGEGCFQLVSDKEEVEAEAAKYHFDEAMT